MSQFANLDKADWILINTFYKLSVRVVDTMSKVCPLLTIGPTIPSIYLDKSIDDEDDYGISLCEIDASLSINWLSTKPTGSVVYVSFGSCATLNNKQMEEIAWGLKRSNFHFLWVVMDSEKGKIPEGFVEEVLCKTKIVPSIWNQSLMDPRKVKWQQTLISILSVTSSQCLTAYPAIRELLLGQFSNFLEARWLIWNSFNELEVEV
ncbi:hypothetical protein NC651_018971 [Populus alba x Populus x berolinensis]|nr:hypothetical protein NC651_018971 [Populus alba x Populus x berolinensis]